MQRGDLAWGHAVRTCRHKRAKDCGPRLVRECPEQLYSPGEQRNARDSLFDQRLLMTINNDGERNAARFDFFLTFD